MKLRLYSMNFRCTIEVWFTIITINTTQVGDHVWGGNKLTGHLFKLRLTHRIARTSKVAPVAMTRNQKRRKSRVAQVGSAYVPDQVFSVQCTQTCP
jgi:hypothetical protein